MKKQIEKLTWIFFSLLKGSGGGDDMETEDVSMESQTSIVFTPRKKKSSDDTMKKSKADAGYKKVVLAGIVGEDVEDGGGLCDG